MIIQDNDYLIKVEDIDDKYHIIIINKNEVQVICEVVLLKTNNVINILYKNIDDISIIHNCIYKFINGEYHLVG